MSFPHCTVFSLLTDTFLTEKRGKKSQVRGNVVFYGKNILRGQYMPQRSPRSDQVVLDRIAGRGTARGHLNLAIDRGQVVVDRAGTDNQMLGDLRICESLCQQAQHLDLPSRQSIGIGWRLHWRN